MDFGGGGDDCARLAITLVCDTVSDTPREATNILAEQISGIRFAGVQNFSSDALR
jgi:hypothetical protein